MCPNFSNESTVAKREGGGLAYYAVVVAEDNKETNDTATPTGQCHQLHPFNPFKKRH